MEQRTWSPSTESILTPFGSSQLQTGLPERKISRLREEEKDPGIPEDRSARGNVYPVRKHCCAREEPIINVSVLFNRGINYMQLSALILRVLPEKVLHMYKPT